MTQQCVHGATFVIPIFKKKKRLVVLLRVSSLFFI
jgi:hypothetical protein